MRQLKNNWGQKNNWVRGGWLEDFQLFTIVFRPSAGTRFQPKKGAANLGLSRNLQPSKSFYICAIEFGRVLRRRLRLARRLFSILLRTPRLFVWLELNRRLPCCICLL